MLIKIGELARRAGLTVRTLHHYDTIGLLSPSLRSEGGFRLYSQDDVIRLQHIQMLKQLGCSLSAIRAILADHQVPIVETVARQISVIEVQMKKMQTLRNRLVRLHEHISRGENAGYSDWLTILEVMALYENCFSEQEINLLHANKIADNLDCEWRHLGERIQDLLDRHIPADDESAQKVQWQWVQLMVKTTGNNSHLALKFKALHEDETLIQAMTGITLEMVGYISEAMAIARKELLRKYLSSEEVESVCLRYPRHISNWPPLIAEVRRQIDKGTGFSDSAVQILVDRWESLVRATFCGDNRILAGKIRSAFRQDADLQLSFGLDMKTINFVHQAIMARQNVADNPAEIFPFASKTTAFRVAQLRAAHQLLDKPLIFKDPLALRVLGSIEEQALRSDPGRFNEPFARGLRTSVVIRSRLAEDEWKNSYLRGLRQYVILGAGLDTFACRGTDDNTMDTAIFEVDLPKIQEWKRACLLAAGISIPPALTFVPADFESMTLALALEQAGFHQDEPAFFSWLGVTMYLEPETITNTLQYVAALPPKSAIVFDYGVVPALLTPRERKAMETLEKKLEICGEPWKTSFDPALLVGQLRSFGYKNIEDFGPEKLSARYLHGRTDGLRKSGVTRLICAEV